MKNFIFFEFGPINSNIFHYYGVTFLVFLFSSITGHCSYSITIDARCKYSCVHHHLDDGQAIFVHFHIPRQRSRWTPAIISVRLFASIGQSTYTTCRRVVGRQAHEWVSCSITRRKLNITCRVKHGSCMKMQRWHATHFIVVCVNVVRGHPVQISNSADVLDNYARLSNND